VLTLFALILAFTGCSNEAAPEIPSHTTSDLTGPQFRILYDFPGSPGGADPTGPLILAKGLLYGTAESGGADNYGTVFDVSRTGAESVLYGFKGYLYNDGAAPARPG
jgi:uncharacterized repeat protein (TIGR03803 family)